MSSASALRYTYEDYLELPDDQRAEVIDGELFVTPAPTTYHQRITVHLSALLHAFVRKSGFGEVLVAPCDVVLSPEDVVQPDILWVARDRLSIIGENYVSAAPDLVVEVLSKGSVKRDRVLKRDLYARAGVRELWIVDPSAKTIEIFAQSGGQLAPRGRLAGSGLLRSQLLPGLEIPLSEVF